jgi:hypothetical protein
LPLRPPRYRDRIVTRTTTAGRGANRSNRLRAAPVSEAPMSQPRWSPQAADDRSPRYASLRSGDDLPGAGTGQGQRRPGTSTRSHPLRTGASGRVFPDSVAATRRAVMAGICPFCGRGPFLVVAGHTQTTHGVDRFELRERADLTYSTSILDASTREEVSSRAKARLAAGVPLPTNSGTAKTRRLSPACRRIASEKLLRFAELIGPEAIAQQRIEAARRHGEMSRKPHPCPVCGAVLPKSTPVTCSQTCRRIIRVRTARASAAKRAGQKC